MGAYFFRAVTGICVCLSRMCTQILSKSPWLSDGDWPGEQVQSHGNEFVSETAQPFVDWRYLNHV